jgi:hypothetical protein
MKAATRGLPQLIFQIADQLLKALCRERVRLLSQHPARLFKPSFQFFPVALDSHGDTPLTI